MIIEQLMVHSLAHDYNQNKALDFPLEIIVAVRLVCG